MKVFDCEARVFQDAEKINPWANLSHGVPARLQSFARDASESDANRFGGFRCIRCV